MKRFPQIPKTIRGAGGSIRIKVVNKVESDEGEDCFGTWDAEHRVVRLERKQPIAHRWKTLFHELTHAALSDAGLQDLFTDEGNEALCNAMATSMIQAMRGMLEMKE